MRKFVLAVNVSLDGLGDRIDLKLAETKQFNSGIVALHYLFEKK